MIQQKLVKVLPSNSIKDHYCCCHFLRTLNMEISLLYQIFPQITMIKQDDAESTDIRVNIQSEILAIILSYLIKHDLQINSQTIQLQLFPCATVIVPFKFDINFKQTITTHHQMWMKCIQQNEEPCQKLQQVQFSLDQITSNIIQNHIDTTVLRIQLLEYLMLDLHNLTFIYYIFITLLNIPNKNNYRLKQNQQTFPIYSKIIINKILSLLLTPNLNSYHIPTNFESYTLVLDMDETLIYYDGDKVHQRPFLLTFLKQMSRLYQLILFTAGLESYANRILSQLTIKKYFTHLLFRQHTNIYQDFYGKDLRKLGRLLSRTIIIDNTPECFSLQPENGIQIQTWKGEQSDSILLNLIPILKTLRFSNKDVRMKLREYKNCPGLIFPK